MKNRRNIFFDEDLNYAYGKVFDETKPFSDRHYTEGEIKKQFNEIYGKEFNLIKIKSSRKVTMLETKETLYADQLHEINPKDIKKYYKHKLEVEEIQGAK